MNEHSRRLLNPFAHIAISQTHNPKAILSNYYNYMINSVISCDIELIQKQLWNKNAWPGKGESYLISECMKGSPTARTDI